MKQSRYKHYWFQNDIQQCKRSRTDLFSIQSQEYSLIVDPGNLNNGVQIICCLNQETLKRSISSQALQKIHSQAQFEL